MYTPPIDNEIPDFPVGKRNVKIQLPSADKIEVGDIIIARYKHSRWEGPTEVLFEDSVGFGKTKDIEEMIWLKPIFPNPIREASSWKIPRRHRKIITTEEAKQRVVTYARAQIGENYSYSVSK